MFGELARRLRERAAARPTERRRTRVVGHLNDHLLEDIGMGHLRGDPFKAGHGHHSSSFVGSEPMFRSN